MIQQRNYSTRDRQHIKEAESLNYGYQEINGFQAIGTRPSFLGHSLFLHLFIVVVVVERPVATTDALDAVQIDVNFHVNTFEVLSVGNLRVRVSKHTSRISVT